MDFSTTQGSSTNAQSVFKNRKLCAMLHVPCDESEEALEQTAQTTSRQSLLEIVANRFLCLRTYKKEKICM